MESSHYVKLSLYLPTCQIVKKESNAFIQCIVNQTIGFPISEDCFTQIKMNFCYYTSNNSKKIVCVESESTS
jgi:hypothetical protein